MNTIGQTDCLKTSLTILSSEFICYLSSCTSIDEAQFLQKKLREEHPKANHHCLAYRVRPESVQEFASDDGEPSGTAGLPMLNVFKRKDLVNICAVVVRYFGGTKLGKKGLIDAYREAVELGLSSCEMHQLEKRMRFTVQFPYDVSSEIQRIIHGFSLRVESESFKENVVFTLSVADEHAFQIESRFLALVHHKVECSELIPFFA